jgi:hypothetical protein
MSAERNRRVRRKPPRDQQWCWGYYIAAFVQLCEKSAQVTPVVVPLRVELVGLSLAVCIIMEFVVQIPELGERFGVGGRLDLMGATQMRTQTLPVVP